MNVIDVLISVLNRSLNDILGIDDERRVHDLLADRCKAYGLYFKKRVSVCSDVYPRMEVDLLWNEWAIEVKLNPNFYDGVGQAIMLKELYGKRSVLLQVWDRPDERILNALRKIGGKLGLKILIVDKENNKVLMVS